MAKKACCEGKVRYLVWAVAFVTVAVLAGTFFLPKRDTGTANAAVARLLPKPAAEQAAAVDGFTMATPKGGVKLVRQTSTQALANKPFSPVPVDNIQELLNNVVAIVKPSVVHIEAMRADPLGANGQVESIGSGIIIDRRGYVLTNYHVLDEAPQITLTIYTKAGPLTYDGKLVHSDAGSDLAVIQILGDTDFSVAKLGSPSALDVGDWVLAIGSPLDLAQTVSFGIVSALRETVRVGGTTYADMIQTDAHINKGNSGGPLVNMYGEVIGINTAIYTPNGDFTGVGFAIPIDHAQALLDELAIAPHRFSAAVANLTKSQANIAKKGSWLGVQGVSASPELATRYDLPVNRGVYITGIFVNSPAHRAGLQRDDIVVSVDGNPIRSIDELRSLLARTSPGQTLGMGVCRAESLLELTTITTAKW